VSVRAKILTVVLFVATVPLALSTWTTIRVHEAAFDLQLAQNRRQTAQSTAAVADLRMDQVVQGLQRAVTSTPWAQLNADERRGGLWFVYRQLREVGAVTLLDERGEGIDTVYQAGSDSEGHPVMSASDLEKFGRSIPLDASRRTGVAMGDPFAAGGTPVVSIAFAAGDNAPGQTVAVAVSLDGICAVLASQGLLHTDVYLVDRQRRIICTSRSDEPLLSQAPAAFAFQPGGDELTTREIRTAGADASFLALTPTSHRWTVVTKQRVSDALGPSREIRNRTIFWIAIGLVGAVLSAFFIVQVINRRIELLANGARAVASGDFRQTLPVEGDDELAKLSDAFNRMCREIQTWNAELNRRVDDRTRELKEAQNQLLEAKKMSAMASLGAGVAHEINNPLTSVIVMTQVVLNRIRKRKPLDEAESLLSSVEKEALRIADIVKRMLTMSQSQGEGFMDHRVADVLDAALAPHRLAIEKDGVELVRKMDASLLALRCNQAQFADALSNIIDNALKAMRASPKILSISAESVEDELIRIEIADTGCGIAADHLDKIFEPFFTTKQGDWRGVGLGLAVAHRILTGHQATLKVSSEIGKGTRMTIVAPAARKRAHLV
jgi:two-component system, NtrC family, sensor kinase